MSPSFVLILILLDNGLLALIFVAIAIFYYVLILILLDNGLLVGDCEECEADKKVLILILLDNGLLAKPSTVSPSVN